ncbi:MAG: DUF47 domain-containing protein [Thermocladium sp.]
MRNMFARLLNPFIRGEAELFSGLRRHIELAHKAITLLESLSANPSSQDITSIISEVSILENQGDSISRELTQEISSGAISTPLIGDVEMLVGKIDDILDKTYVLAREMRRALTLCNTPIVLSMIEKSLREEIQLTRRGLEDLMEVLDSINKGGTYSATKEHTLAIEKLEEMVDDVKDNAIDELYSKVKDMGYAEFLSLLNMIFEVDDVMDSIKDASFMIITILRSLGS